VIAEAMLATGLDRRIAFAILARPGVAASPTRLLVAFALLTAGVSAWMNNTSDHGDALPDRAFGADRAGARSRARADAHPLRDVADARARVGVLDRRHHDAGSGARRT